MKTFIKSSSNDRDFRFQSELNSAVYRAITDVIFKYRDYFDNSEESSKSIEDAVDTAVDWWSVHFFESDDWEG